MSTVWDEVKPKGSEQGWEPLPENGWFALMAWTAGLENVGRLARNRSSVDESVNEFRLAAGVPARPSGFDWFLRVPDGWPAGLSLADELSSQITRAWENGTHPATLVPIFERAVKAFYADAPA